MVTAGCRDARLAADDIVDEEERPDVVVGDRIRLDGVEDLVVLQGDGCGVLAAVVRHTRNGWNR